MNINKQLNETKWLVNYLWQNKKIIIQGVLMFNRVKKCASEYVCNLLLHAQSIQIIPK